MKTLGYIIYAFVATCQPLVVGVLCQTFTEEVPKLTFLIMCQN